MKVALSLTFAVALALLVLSQARPDSRDEKIQRLVRSAVSNMDTWPDRYAPPYPQPCTSDDGPVLVIKPRDR